MKNYSTHLEQMYDNNSFIRKINYIRYNFVQVLRKIDIQSSVLEVGPGKGEFISYLNSIGVFNIDVIDNDKTILGNIKDKYQVRKTILSDSFDTLDKKLGKYNLIIMVQVLEHLPIEKHQQIIEMLYRHLIKNGYLIIVVPNAGNPLGLVERYGDLQHMTSFTQQSLKDLANYSGIHNSEISIKGFEIPPYSLINIIRISFQKILHILLLGALIINGGIYFEIMTPNIMLWIKKSKP